MHRLRLSVLLALLFTICPLASATLQAQRSVAPAALQAPPAVFTPRAAPVLQPSVARQRGGGSVVVQQRVRTVSDEGTPKAAYGAGIGFAVGAIFGLDYAERCRPTAVSPCTRKRSRWEHVIGFGILGAVVGTVTGAVLDSR